MVRTRVVRWSFLEVMLLDHDEPSNYDEAMMSPDSANWFKAMKSEIGSMYENKVWNLVDLPDDRQAIENKWIFKKKNVGVKTGGSRVRGPELCV